MNEQMLRYLFYRERQRELVAEMDWLNACISGRYILDGENEPLVKQRNQVSDELKKVAAKIKELSICASD